MEYLIKVSAILVLFYVCYKLFLNRETFFESNRSFLLVGLITSFILPYIVIPKYIIKEPAIVKNSFAFGNSMSQSMMVDNSISLITILTYIYLAGVFFFLSRFLYQFGSLIVLYINSTKQRVTSFIYVITKKTLSPFSFFNWIVFNPIHFNKTELDQIIIHEKVHAKQLHSIDILLVEITNIILWFNPLVWLYKKDLRQNLEFIADKNAQATTSCKKSYQHLLLKTSVPNYNLALTNNFYNSLIKKRIVMLHKNKSKNRNQLKFLLVMPALVLFLMSFNTKEIYIESNLNSNKSTSTVLDLNAFEFSNSEANVDEPQPMTSKKITTNNNPIKDLIPAKQDIVTYFIESDFTDEQIDNVKTKLKTHGITLKIKNVKRNSDNEITALKIDAKSGGSNANFSISNDTAIKTVRITYNAKDKSISIGNTNSLLHNKDYEYLHKDGAVTITKSGKGNNVFVYSNEDKHDGDYKMIEEDGKIIIKSDNAVLEYKKSDNTKNKNGFVISEGNKIIELKSDSIKASTFIIKTGKKGKTINKWKNKDGNIFIHSDDDKDGNFIIKSTGAATILSNDNDEGVHFESIGKGKNKILISTNGDKKPLYIVDGKEVAKKDLVVDPNNIESVNVIKGEAAKKLYGKKSKNGVIVITTKKKKN